ncbi:hypothetical protein BH10PLA2_BH10PLA2_30430 [soil metagenome]
MSRLQFGIVGTGMIANVIATAIANSTKAKLTAVSSRRLETAQSFVANRPGVAAVQSAEALIARPDVDAIYIATPTVAKEAIALAAIAAGKHVLVEKPFIDKASVLRMTTAATKRSVAFMDATHFVHHQRTSTIQAQTQEKIGAPHSLHTVFYFPFSDSNNIRFDRTQEPMTALGDMAWYSMRAVVEYLRPAGRISKVVTVAERDAKTQAIIQASGLIAFDSGEVSTFDIGYTASTILMDLQLLGRSGVIEVDDFVLDWTDSFAFKNPDIGVGYMHRTGMASRKEIQFVPTPSGLAQEVLMIDNFAELSVPGSMARRAKFAEATLKTQEYLDALWSAANA